MDYYEQMGRMHRASQEVAKQQPQSMVARMTAKQEATYDIYAAAALQALIAKLPLIDRDGDFSEPMEQEAVRNVKRQIASSAHEYALLMMEERKPYMEYLSEICEGVSQTAGSFIADRAADVSEPLQGNLNR